MANEIGEVEIDVTADARPAVRKLRDSRGRFIKAGEQAGDGYSEGFQKSSSRGVTRQQNSMGRQMGAWASRLGSNLGRNLGKNLGSSLGGALASGTKLTAIFTAAAAATASLGAGLINIMSLLGSLGPAVGALGTLPGVIGALGAAFATIKVGVSGLGEAFKNMGDPEKFSEALSKLAPSAASFARAVKSVGPAWKEMQQAVQQNLFEGLDDVFRRLSSTYLPVLTSGMGKVADSANSAATQIGAALTKAQSVKGVQAIFEGSAVAVGNFGEFLGKAMPGVLQLTGASTRLFGELTKGFGDAGTRFSEWVNQIVTDGSFEAWTRRGLDVLKDLGSAIGGLGRIFGGIFKAAEGAGGSTIASLAKGLNGIADLVNGPAFQTGLTNFFVGIKEGAAGLGQAGPQIGNLFKVLGTELGDTLAKIGPNLGSILGSIADALSALLPVAAKVIQGLAPVVDLLVGALSKGIQAVAPYLQKAADGLASLTEGISVDSLSGIGDAISGMIKPETAQAIQTFVEKFSAGFQQALPQIKQFFADMQPYVAEFMSASQDAFAKLLPILTTVGGVLFPALGNAIKTLAPIFVQIWTAIAQLAGALMSILGPALQWLAPFIQTHVGGVITVFQGIFTTVLGVIRLFAAVLKGDWSAAWSALGTILIGVWNVIKGIVTVFLNTLKMLLSAAWAFIKAAATTAWAQFRAVIMAVWVGIKAGIMAQVNAIKSTLSAAWTVIRAGATAAWNGIRAAITVAINAVRAVVSAVVNAIRSTVTGAWNAIRATSSAVWNGIKAVITGSINAVRSTISSVMSAIRGVMTSAWNAVKAGASAAWNGMRSIVSSAINAVKSTVSNGISNVVSTIRGLPGKITSALGNLGSLLTQKGRDLIQGLINGITEKIGALKSKVGEAAGAVKDLWPGSPVKEGPLRSWNYGGGVSGAGRRLGEGLAQGIAASADSVAKSAGRVAAVAGSTLAPAGATGRSSAPAAPRINITAPRQMSPAEMREAIIAGFEGVSVETNIGSRNFQGAMRRVENDRRGR